MNIVYERCAGLDVHKKTVVVCAISADAHGQRSKEWRTFSTMTPDLLRRRNWLKAVGVTHVAMESTGIYTPPPMLQIGGGTARSGCREDRTDAEDNADLPLIYLNPFDQ